MGKKTTELNKNYIDFIQQQKIFFVATAPTDTDQFVNCSPKGLDSLRVIDNKKIIWLNLTGSGNESATHVLENSRMTLMFCSFDERALVLRTYGKAKVYHYGSDKFNQYTELFGNLVGSRQIFELDIEMVQASCGFAVPYYEFKGERHQLTEWTENKSQKENGLKEYWFSRNNKTVNGENTNIENLVE